MAFKQRQVYTRYFFFGKLTAAPDAFTAVSKTTTAAASNFPTAILIYSIIYISVSSLYEMCAHTIGKMEKSLW